MAVSIDLKGVPLFSTLRDDELNAIAPLFAVRAYPKNAILVSEGDTVAALTLILSGKIRQFWIDEDGEQMDLAILAAGEHLTHAALLGEPVLVSSIALEPAVVAAIKPGDFETLLARFPRVAVHFVKDLLRVERNLIQRARVFAMEGVYGRVVWFLLRRAALVDGKRITDRMTHSDIGRRIGATREMVGQVLRDLSRGGYISSSGGRFTILKEPPPRR